MNNFTSDLRFSRHYCCCCWARRSSEMWQWIVCHWVVMRCDSGQCVTRLLWDVTVDSMSLGCYEMWQWTVCHWVVMRCDSGQCVTGFLWDVTLDSVSLGCYEMWQWTVCHWVITACHFEGKYCFHLPGLRGPRRKNPKWNPIRLRWCVCYIIGQLCFMIIDFTESWQQFASKQQYVLWVLLWWWEQLL
jgi:hypothetical protein